MIWLIVLAGIIVYLASLWFAPYRKCWVCHGSKTHGDVAYKGTFGFCWFCHGSGRRIRWGVRLLRPGTARAIRAGKHGRNY